jgi:hypothetical protein
MSEAGKRPDLRELVGVALNSSTLTMQRSNQETPLTRIAAMGAAALAVKLGADVENVPIAGSQGDGLRQAAGSSRRAGGGALTAAVAHPVRRPNAVPRAVELFTLWLAPSALLSNTPSLGHEALIGAFTARVMHEWLSDKCSYCGGSKKQERSKIGQWIKPQGSMQRNATFRPCTACSGSGRSAIRHPDRTKLLGLTREQYEHCSTGLIDSARR